MSKYLFRGVALTLFHVLSAFYKIKISRVRGTYLITTFKKLIDNSSAPSGV